MVYRYLRVFGGRDSLEHERQPRKLLDAVNRVPRNRRRVSRIGPLAASRRRIPPREHRTLATAVTSRVNRDAQPYVSRLLDSRHALLYPRPVAVQIELEDLGIVNRRGDGFQARVRYRTHYVHRAELRSRPRRAGAGVRMEDLQRADRRQQRRDSQLSTQKRRGCVHARHVHQHARTERHAVESQPVAPHRRLRLRRARQVVPRALLQILARALHYLFVAQKLDRHQRPLLVRYLTPNSSLVTPHKAYTVL